MQPRAEHASAMGEISLGRDSKDYSKMAEGIANLTKSSVDFLGAGSDALFHHNLVTENVGDDKKDHAIFLEMAKYGVDTPGEIKTVINRIGNGEVTGGVYGEAYKAYFDKSIDADTFVRKFGAMLQSLKFTVEE